MNTEFEVRVLEVDEKEMERQILSLGGKKVGEWFQKRFVYDFNPKRENEWIRLRTNGNETTLTYKNVEKNDIDGTKELEIVVDDFEKTNELLNVLGYTAKGYQENKRVRYVLNDVEIDLDSWPLIPTYMEIEGKGIEEVEKTLNLLNVDLSKKTALNCEDIYIQVYGIDIKSIKDLKF